MEIICGKYNYPEFINVACSSYCACSMTLHDYISYARSHRVESGVGACYCYSPFLVNVSRPHSRSDPNGGSEPSPGARLYTGTH